jgi:hypothetical protein
MKQAWHMHLKQSPGCEAGHVGDEHDVVEKFDSVLDCRADDNLIREHQQHGRQQQQH